MFRNHHRTSLFRVGFGVLVAGVLLLPAARAHAAPVLIDFEGLGDFEAVTTQYPGVTFGNTIAVTSGISLNEFETPPRSGTNAVFDDGGAITLGFDSPVSHFAGYFTYSTTLTLTAFDASLNVIGTATSLFANNFALTGVAGSAPNELLELVLAGIAFVRIEGDPLGGSFVLDDVTFDTAAVTTAVPEPSTLALIAGGLALLRARRRRV
jgi:hypothetical protein